MYTLATGAETTTTRVPRNKGKLASSERAMKCSFRHVA